MDFKKIAKEIRKGNNLTSDTCPALQGNKFIGLRSITIRGGKVVNKMALVDMSSGSEVITDIRRHQIMDYDDWRII